MKHLCTRLQVRPDTSGSKHRLRHSSCNVSDDPAAPYITTRKPIANVQSPHALALARQQIDECVHGHERCKSSASPNPFLPTRVVDCADLSRPRLVSTIGRCGEYLALSYVWGGDQVHKTTKSNISTYEQGIAPSLLPPTICDAIRVTHMLGFRWLWIDSLCIIQDSDEDKAHEIGRMHHIYRYAHVTIMAGSAEAVGSGFLQERSHPNDDLALPFICPPDPPTSAGSLDARSAARRQVGQVYLTGLAAARRSHGDDLGRMSTRAWCMQEFLMSPRALIFTPITVQFKCLTGLVGVGHSFCATFERGVPQLPMTLFLANPPDLEHGSEEWNNLRRAWMQVVLDYTRRTATEESDKLVACAAVAEQFHRVLGTEYLAGLWRSDALLTDLLWASARLPGGRYTRPTTYRAPSWSWAAVEGIVNHRSTWNPAFEDPQSVALAKVVECRVTLENLALPFGKVTDGTLILSATLIPCRGGPAARSSGGWWYVHLPSFERVRRQQRGVALGGLDSPEEEDEAGSTKVGDGATFIMDCDADDFPGMMWAVPIVRMKGNSYEDKLDGIVLELAPPSDRPGPGCRTTRFRRIGQFWEIIQLAGDTDFTEHPLWGPFSRAMQDGTWPLVDIEIV